MGSGRWNSLGGVQGRALITSGSVIKTSVYRLSVLAESSSCEFAITAKLYSCCWKHASEKRPRVHPRLHIINTPKGISYMLYYESTSALVNQNQSNIYSTLFTIYMAAIAKSKSTIKQSSKQHTSIGQTISKVTDCNVTPYQCMCHTGRLRTNKVSRNTWYITQYISSPRPSDLIWPCYGKHYQGDYQNPQIAAKISFSFYLLCLQQVNSWTYHDTPFCEFVQNIFLR